MSSVRLDRGCKTCPYRFPGWLNRWRRLSKDFEHLVKNSEAMVYWASIRWLPRYVAPAPDQERLYVRKTAALMT